MFLPAGERPRTGLRRRAPLELSARPPGLRGNAAAACSVTLSTRRGHGAKSNSAPRPRDRLASQAAASTRWGREGPRSAPATGLLVRRRGRDPRPARSRRAAPRPLRPRRGAGLDGAPHPAHCRLPKLRRGAGRHVPVGLEDTAAYGPRRPARGPHLPSGRARVRGGADGAIEHGAAALDPRGRRPRTRPARGAPATGTRIHAWPSRPGSSRPRRTTPLPGAPRPSRTYRDIGPGVAGGRRDGLKPHVDEASRVGRTARGARSRRQVERRPSVRDPAPRQDEHPAAAGNTMLQEHHLCGPAVARGRPRSQAGLRQFWASSTRPRESGPRERARTSVCH